MRVTALVKVYYSWLSVICTAVNVANHKNREVFRIITMARVVKAFRTLRNHWKKSTVAVCVLSYGGYWLYGKHWWVSELLDFWQIILFLCPKCCTLCFISDNVVRREACQLAKVKYRLLKCIHNDILFVLTIIFSLGIWTSIDSTPGAAEKSYSDFEPCSFQRVRE